MPSEHWGGQKTAMVWTKPKALHLLLIEPRPLLRLPIAAVRPFLLALRNCGEGFYHGML